MCNVPGEELLLFVYNVGAHCICTFCVQIAMISPGLSSCEHTLNTLRYADRCVCVCVCVCVCARAHVCVCVITKCSSRTEGHTYMYM